MIDLALYSFKIEGFTPQSMPFGRLAEYYAEIRKMLGDVDGVHLVGIEEGSHASKLAIDPNYEPELMRTLTALREGTASKQSLRAQATINAMLKEDGTSGAFYDAANQNVLKFPGKGTDDGNLIRLRDSATFIGELYYIAGAGNDAKTRIRTDAYGVVFCTTTREIAKALRGFLFEDVKVSGRGMWTKLKDGSWDIDDFCITDFAPVKRESLRAAVNRLRAIDIDWPDDVLGEIRSFEERNGTDR